MNDERELVINWFPGHMKRAMDQIREYLPLCDAIVYVLDGRAPLSCLNPEFDELVQRKPTLFVLNKIDLTPNGTIDFFKKSEAFHEIKRKKGGAVAVISLDSRVSGSGKKLIDGLRTLLRERLENARAKGVIRPIRAIVIGVTNSGKSTLINNLAKKAKTITGDRPGVTRTKQWISIGEAGIVEKGSRQGAPSNTFWILDTPGTLWPRLEDQNIAKNLAYLGSIKDDILDIVAVARSLLLRLEQLQKGSVLARFGTLEFDDIARKRGLVLKAGQIDEERTAKAILGDFREGRIGRFNLDKI